jgi:hypothetical protein
MLHCINGLDLNHISLASAIQSYAFGPHPLARPTDETRVARQETMEIKSCSATNVAPLAAKCAESCKSCGDRGR